MALPVTIPNTFANATSSIPLSQLDTNFSTLANAVNGLNSGSETLANLKATTANVGVLTVTGNATIGDASTDTVTLNSTLTANTAVIFAAGTSAAPSITTTGDTNTGIFFPAADTIAFAEGGAEAMRLDASGNLGLGVTPSAWNTGYRVFEIGTSFAAIGSSGAADLYFNSFLNQAGNFIYRNTDAASAYSLASGQHRWYTAPSGTAGNAITFTQAMTLNASGGLQCLNTVGVGNATPSTSGAGITFPATQSASSNANTLDDYEEGNGTVTLTSGSGSLGTVSAGSRYTKVGRLVTVVGDITVGTVSTPGGTLKLTSLPFAANSSFGRGYQLFISRNGWNISTLGPGQVFGNIEDSATTCDIFFMYDDGASREDQLAQFVGNNATFNFTLVYFSA